MRDRVMGGEIEWLGNFRPNPNCRWQEAGNLFESIKAFLCKKYSINNSGELFLPNGSRFYHESTGNHIETTTPECGSARDVLKYEKWQERFMCRLSKELKDSLGEFVFQKKNSSDNLADTRGSHESYLSDKMFSDLLSSAQARLYSMPPTMDPRLNYLILFLITRQIFTGSGGGILSCQDNSRNDYVISPRAYFIETIFSSSSTSSRPIIHIRKEALADDSKYWRNHFILGDANMADLSIFLKFGTTSAVLEMIEEGFYDKTLNMFDPREAANLFKKISGDLTLRNVPIRLVGGGDEGVIGIQKRFCQDFKRYLGYSGQGGEKLEIAQRWWEILECLQGDDEKVYRELDYKIKFRLLNDYMTARGLSLSDNKVRMLDLDYHSSDPKKSFYYLLKNRPSSKFESLVSESKILERGGLPPNTRAKLRAQIQLLLEELDMSYSLNWDLVSFKPIGSDVPERKLHLPEPRVSSFDGLNFEKNYDAIDYLNSLKPGAIKIRKAP
ncbi:MAG: proteasome accessory factor PafA2 family protein [Parcubacteria group bacterium]|nr:proteasome accessory factor PafA2 family protein [Parcubacteria group bacterium]